MIPKAVLFDCDGVIVDSEPVTNAILVENLNARGLHLTIENAADMFVGGTLASVGELAEKMGALLEPDWLPTIYAEIFSKLRENTPLISGIDQVLDQLDLAEIAYAVGSNGPMRKMEITVGQHPSLWPRLNRHLYSAHVHAKPKPAPDLYLYAAQQLGIDPTECVVVDDSVAGCTAAMNAGIRCFGLAEHDDGKSLANVGAIPFHHMSQLPSLLGL